MPISGVARFTRHRAAFGECFFLLKGIVADDKIDITYAEGLLVEVDPDTSVVAGGITGVTPASGSLTVPSRGRAGSLA